MNDNRYGAAGVGDWQKLPAQSSSAMSAPASAAACADVAGARRVEWVWRKPASLTGYTIHWGRWVSLPADSGGGALTGKWVEVGTTVVASGASSSELYLNVASYEVNGDAVAAYVDNFTGSPTDPVQLWYRVIP